MPLQAARDPPAAAVMHRAPPQPQPQAAPVRRFVCLVPCSVSLPLLLRVRLPPCALRALPFGFFAPTHFPRPAAVPSTRTMHHHDRRHQRRHRCRRGAQAADQPWPPGVSLSWLQAASRRTDAPRPCAETCTSKECCLPGRQQQHRVSAFGPPSQSLLLPSSPPPLDKLIGDAGAGQAGH